MNTGDENHEQALRAAERAQAMLSQPTTMDSYDWGLVVTLIVEADEALKRAQADDPSIMLPLLDTAVEELRAATSNFTNSGFIKATRAGRRQKPGLFTMRR